VELLIAVVVFLVLLVAWDARDAARHRRDRESLRHVTGAKPWWGKR